MVEPVMHDGAIERMGYLPQSRYAFDLEIYSMSSMRRRARQDKIQTTHRYDFHMLVCVTHGHSAQMVDAQTIDCCAGALLVIQPGQTHNFGSEVDWDGWVVLFRPEFVPPAASLSDQLSLAFALQALPEHIALRPDELRRLCHALSQLREDAQLAGRFENVQSLLRHQLHAIVAWLAIVQDSRPSLAQPCPQLQRVRRFQHLVEQRHGRWHQVADYANRLGCVEKSLARAVGAVLGITPKAYITRRINLEAKRLLTHTDLQIAAIAERLGFAETTHFSKFFKRECGCTPVEFRRRHAERENRFQILR